MKVRAMNDGNIDFLQKGAVGKVSGEDKKNNALEVHFEGEQGPRWINADNVEATGRSFSFPKK